MTPIDMPAPGEVLTPIPAHPDDARVYVEVSGLTGTGKSAVMGEIEIALRAIGLTVEHGADFQTEKNMTHADWQESLDLYKPTVVIRERNVPRAASPVSHPDDAASAGEPVAWPETLEWSRVDSGALYHCRASYGDYVLDVVQGHDEVWSYRVNNTGRLHLDGVHAAKLAAMEDLRGRLSIRWAAARKTIELYATPPSDPRLENDLIAGHAVAVTRLKARLDRAVEALEEISRNRVTKAPGTEWAETYTGGHCAASEKCANIADQALAAIRSGEA